MKIVKIGLLVFTMIITVLLLVFTVIMYNDTKTFQGAASAFFFLACTSGFSIFFHSKTLQYYPLKKFDKIIQELSKKYWALNISLGVIISILGITMITVYFKRENYYVSIFLIGILLVVFGIVTLIETYLLHKFVATYQERLERQEEIDDIKGMIK